jgi:hypothetical protein
MNEAVVDALNGSQDVEVSADIERYLTHLLLNFLHTDELYSLTTENGERITSIYEMLARADVRLGANSFEEERAVHKHVADFILFWRGINPDYLGQRLPRQPFTLSCDYSDQAKRSYYVVSTFDYGEYRYEAPVFRRLSEDFEAWASALGEVRRQLPMSFPGA